MPSAKKIFHHGKIECKHMPNIRSVPRRIRNTETVDRSSNMKSLGLPVSKPAALEVERYYRFVFWKNCPRYRRSFHNTVDKDLAIDVIMSIKGFAPSCQC